VLIYHDEALHMVGVYRVGHARHVLRWWAWARTPRRRRAERTEGGLINFLRPVDSDGWTGPEAQRVQGQLVSEC